MLTFVFTNNGYDGLALDGNMDLPNGKRGTYDYFIRDYQQNVRMILTEETHTALSHCTMEIPRQGNEEPVFGQTGAGNEVAATRTAKPEGWQSNTSASVSKLSALSHKAGPNVLLKVMAGDQVSATTNYYYKDPVTNSTGNNLTGPILTSLIQSILGSPATGLAKTNTTGISNQLNANTEFLNKTAPDAGNPTGNNPKAYMTVVFFNERFEFVEEGSTALRVTQCGDGAAQLVIPNIKAPKNGYAYVYLSNENAEPVFFDDFKVAHTRGRIIEENHYYAFGLKIAGISSAKFGDEKEGSLKNNYQYQGAFSEMDEDIGWNDFLLRNYDAQIGRWIQQDPYDEFPSPYTGMGNNPVLFIDPDGGCVTCVQTLQEVVVEGVKRTSTTAAASASSKMFTGMMQASMRSITQVANLSSEQSLVKLYMQPFPPPFKEGPTISQGGGYYVSEAQKALNAQRELAAGYTPDESLTPMAKLADNRTFTNLADNVIFSSAMDVAGVFTGFGFARAGLRAGVKGMGKSASKGGATAFRYMTGGELQAIRQGSGAGFLRGGRAGETYFTKDLYKSAAKASQRLGLENTPTLRVEFEILNNPTLLRNATKVLPLKGLSGGGAEFMTLDPVKVRLINWQPLK